MNCNCNLELINICSALIIFVVGIVVGYFIRKEVELFLDEKEN